jgi:maltose O-acetyltransferase
MKTERELMLANEMYAPNDPDLSAMRFMARVMLHKYNASQPGESAFRHEVLHELLGALGEDVIIEPPFYCDYGKNIYLGSNFFANFGCTFLDCNEIRIGNNVMFGPSIQLYTAYHPLEAKARNSGRELAAAISIEDNVWIGGAAIVCPKVTIGKNSVIGAGAVVTKSIPANVFAAGNPCRVIKEIDNAHSD